MSLAIATGAVGYAQRLSALDAFAARPTRAPRRQEPKQGGTLRVGLQLTQIVTLDPPLLTQGIVAGSILPSIHSSLVKFDEQLGIIGDLAETWEVSEDGRDYIFHLRPGLTFHNGDPLNANDFVFTYQRTTNKDFASPHANKLALITEFVATDELTVSLKMSDPFAPFLGVAATRGPGRALTPISKRAVEEMGDEQFGVTPIGSGPFMVVPETVEVGKGLELVPFEGWYGGRPYLDRLIIQLIPEPSSQVSALEAGDIDMMDPVPPTVIAQVRDNPDFTFVEAPGTNWRGLAMNYKRPPWDNYDARLAVSKAIDRNDFVQKAFLGNAVPAVGPIAPAFAWVYRPPSEVQNPQDYNLEEAKALAEKAGLTGLKANALAAEDTVRPTEALRVALAEIGIELQVENLQQAAYTERWTQGDYDTFIHGSTVDADPDDGHWNFFYSEGPWNTYGYKSEKADELLRGTRSTIDQDERMRLFQELQTLLETEVPMAFLYHVPDFVAFIPELKDYTPIPEQRYFEKVWLDQ
jgi:peptide/nickel transport system substrate-binding protein